MEAVNTGRARVFDRKTFEDREYWVRRLDREMESAGPPPDRLPTEEGARATAEFTFEIGEAVRARLSGLSGDRPFLVYTALLGALHACLYRYGGASAVVVASPPRTRDDGGSCPPNTVAILHEVDGAAGFRQLLTGLRQTLLDAYARQDYPFDTLTRELGLEEGEVRARLCRVALGLDGLHGELSDTPFDLSIRVAPGPGRLAGRAVYDAFLFDPGTIRAFVSHWIQLLGSALADVEAPVGGLAMLPREEEERVLRGWNPAPSPYPSRAVHELFEAGAGSHPERVAVAYRGVELTYAELNRRANRLAHHLRARGVGAETRVGLCVDRGVEMVVGMLGILKAGGAYVPLDPAYPEERLRFMLEDSGTRVLVARERLAAALPVEEFETVLLDAHREAIDRESPADPEGLTGPDHLAYVIYTSGSTGTPKGVMVPHRGVARLVMDADYVRLRSSDVVAQASNASFDAATFEVWGALLNGARLVPVHPDLVLDLPAFAAHLRDEGITTLFLTTALFNQIAARVPDAFRTLRHVLFGGELVDPRPVRRVMEEGPPDHLLHVYGPTESTTFSTWHRVADAPGGDGTVPIGRALSNTTAYVVDGGLSPVPPGVPGELLIGGDGLARGYRNRPELTAEKFVPDPFGGVPGARLYRTGDRVRWNAEGAVEFLGRTDQQVKIRGFRIEPGEVEAALLRHPGVREAVVEVREDEPGERRLVAYVAAADTAALEAGELRAWLGARLPDYMVPSALVVLDALPLNPNGKVDRRALPRPDEVGGEGESVAPRTPVEEVLAGIWADVLRLPRVGASDHFFERGGHSLLATQVVSRVREVFGVEVPLRVLFEAPVLEEFAAAVDAALREKGGVPSGPILPYPRDTHPPLSFAQQRIWFLDQLDPASATYNMPLPFRVRGDLDPVALERSLAEVVRRHESLRTTFRLEGEEPVQVIVPQARVLVPEVDLRGLPEADREREVRRLADEDAARPFDLARGPLLRVTTVRVGERDRAVLLSIHHIVGDGWSMGVLVRELSALYAAYGRGEPSPLPEPVLQYADYAVWQRGWLRGEVLERQTSYWRDKLSGAPPVLELPTDRPYPAVADMGAGQAPFDLSAETARALRGLARQEGATLFMTLLAGWKLLLSRHGGQDDVSVGTPIAGRNRLETEPMIGMFVNTLVLRTDLSGEPSFRELLRRVRETTLGAFTHQDLPFEKLVEELKIERSLVHNPLFQVMFALHRGGRDTLSLGETELETIPGGSAAKFDLDFTAAEDVDRVTGWLTYRTELFDPATAEGMLDRFRRLLDGVAADPDRPAAELPLLAEEERAQLLGGWGAGGAASSPERCVHELFAAQAALTPAAPALAFDGEVVTYAELDARANRLARYLRARGVGPEVRVGICVRRSPEMVVGVLGVLKAGGAYLPLDPSYPPDRLRYMVEDAGARILLTQAVDADDAPPVDGEVVCLDSDWHRIAREEPEAPPSGVGPGNLAFVVYTSGSTGRPKGVLVEHAGLVNAYLAWEETYGLRAGPATHLQMASFSFDVFSGDLVRALCSGGKLVLCPFDTLLSPPDLYALMRREGVDTAEFVPAVLRALLQHLRETGGSLDFMRLLIAGSDAWYVREHEEIRALCSPRTRCVNSYGVAEATIDSTFFESGREALSADAMVPIGRPFAGSRLYVLDARRQPVPAGVPGELYIGGAGVARGYLNRPELTAEKFVPDPFGGVPGERLYRTGDRARWLASGDLEFLGRADHQVKIRGFRIEPAEVAAQLLEHPAVREALVLVPEDAPGERRLVAYVVPEDPSAGCSAPELREFLRARLPEYMVPSALVEMDDFPLSPNGKVDRAALPSPAGDTDLYVPPRTDAEVMVAAIWGDLLRRERVGIHDDFFDLGGHSLLATRVVSRIRDAFGATIPIRRFFEAGTVAELAAAIEAQVLADAGEAALEEEIRRLEAMTEEEVLRLLTAG